ncbi:unnamed protein product [Closterium sp. NIES-54]
MAEAALDKGSSAAAGARGAAPGAPGVAAPAGRTTSVGLLSEAAVEARRQLREFLCSPRWYAGNAMTEARRVRIFKSLPIFEVYSNHPSSTTSSSSSSSSTTTSSSSSSSTTTSSGNTSTTSSTTSTSRTSTTPTDIHSSLPLFVDLSSPSIQRYLAPSGVEPALLGESFLCPSDDREAAVLSRALAIPTLPRPAFFKMQVLARVQTLPPGLRNRTMLAVLQELPQLCTVDPGLRDVVANLAFVPAWEGGEVAGASARAGGAAGGAGVGGAAEIDTDVGNETLCRPVDLYDSRNPELCHLLQGMAGNWFPAAPFSSSSALEMLLSVGLRSAVTTETILSCARAVESIAATDAAVARERGRVLLSYLDVNAARWVPVAQGGSAGAGGVGGRRGMGAGGGGGGAGAGMFARVSSLFQSSEAAEEAQRAAAEMASFWSELTSISWCPVLVRSPAPPFLPWPGGGEANASSEEEVPGGTGGKGRDRERADESRPSPVAPPRIVRPQIDTWLASASLRILDGECRSTLMWRQLGWARPLTCSSSLP